jgi:hypothetical protein
VCKNKAMIFKQKSNATNRLPTFFVKKGWFYSANYLKAKSADWIIGIA